MRTDLTAAFIAAKNSATRKPRQLLVFQFPTAGNIYASDQQITLGGVTYLPLVENWGQLSDATGMDSDISAETRQMNITLWNGGSKPFSEYFLQEDPEDVEVLLYQWFDGLADADKLLLDRFVVQDPISFDEASRLLTLDLVSINMRYVGKCGATVTTALWPYALPEHVGQAIPLIIGDAGECNTLCVKTAPSATLFGSIIAKTQTIDCNEGLGEFSSAGYIQVEQEIIKYSSRVGKRFYVAQRGCSIVGIESSGRENHPDNAEVHQLITDHTYILGELPIASITGVKVDGYPAPASTYSVAIAGTYGKIFFKQKPYSYQFAASAQTLELFSFAAASNNTAWQPHYAYDQNKTSSCAMINELYPTLSLELQSSLSDINGMITTAYLEVHHWETNVYVNDYVEVWVEGIGVVGKLSKPNRADVFWLDAEVDLDHGHDHTTGDQHNHFHYDGRYSANASGHLHPLEGTATQIEGECDAALPGKIIPETNGTKSATLHYNFFNIPAGAVADGAFIRLRADLASVRVEIYYGSYSLGTWDCRTTGNLFIDTTFSRLNHDSYIRFVVYGSNVNGANILIREAGLTWNFDGTMQEAADFVSPYLAQNGVNQDTHNTNHPDDVYPLLTDNAAIEILSKKSPARTLVDRFDLSDFMLPSWSWFAGRQVQVRYVGTVNDVNVFIPWITFVVEFRKKERVYSDRITATVSGSTSKRPDQVLQTLLGKAGLPAAYIDTASFAAAGSWFTANAYTIDGVIEGNLSVAEAIKKVCRQTRCRLYWSGGKAKLAIRKQPADWTIAKYLDADNYQLRSIKANRQSVQDLVNRVELLYGINRTQEVKPYLIPVTGKGAVTVATQGQPYLSSLIKSDAASIAAHGVREQPDNFQFDLVRSYSMANSLADYYLATLAYPSTFYELNAYLEQTELEKEDIVALTSSGFHKIRKMPLRIKEVSRLFGSGKNRSINHLRIIAECLRYILLEKTTGDTVLALDSLIAVVGKLIDMADHVHVQDELVTAEGVRLSEEITIEETLDILWTILSGLEDTATVSEVLGGGMGVLLEDQVRAIEDLAVWRGIGFGSQDFGMFGFGGVKSWGESNPDELIFTELLSGSMGAGINDTVTVADMLAASTGYGSPGTISDGYANIPFGR